MGPHELDLFEDLFCGLEEDGRVACSPRKTMVDHVLGLGLAEGHDLAGGIRCRIGVLHLSHDIEADLFCIGYPFRRAIPSPCSGAVNKADPRLSFTCMIFFYPLHQDLDLITIGSPQRVVVGIL